MSRKALILLESALNGQLYVQAAQRLGLHPIILSINPKRYDYVAATGCETICVDTENLDAMIHECSVVSLRSELAGITSARKSVYATVGKLCQYFNLPGPTPAAVEKCRDKFVQRQGLSDAGVSVPAYYLVANASEIVSSAAEIGFPMIVKPAEGIGGFGVRLCRDIDELAEHTAFLSEDHISRSPRGYWSKNSHTVPISALN